MQQRWKLDGSKMKLRSTDQEVRKSGSCLLGKTRLLNVSSSLLWGVGWVGGQVEVEVRVWVELGNKEAEKPHRRVNLVSKMEHNSSCRTILRGFLSEWIHLFYDCFSLGKGELLEPYPPTHGFYCLRLDKKAVYSK